MKSVFKIGYAGILFIVGLCSCVNDSDYTTGTLKWEENFEDDVIDDENWSKIPRGKADWNNLMSDEDALFDIEDDKLILRGLENTISEKDTAAYITGGVYTKDKQYFGYGRWEIKAKLNGAIGAWPAFWLLPQNTEWPFGGEIDIMERLNYDTEVYQTVHSEYTLDLDDGSSHKNSETSPIDPDEFNVYAVEIHKDSLSFFVNEKRTFTYPRKADIENQYPFDSHEFYLLIDMQLGGDWVGSIDPSDLPVHMEIDWVRFFEFE